MCPKIEWQSLLGFRDFANYAAVYFIFHGFWPTVRRLEILREKERCNGTVGTHLPWSYHYKKIISYEAKTQSRKSVSQDHIMKYCIVSIKKNNKSYCSFLHIKWWSKICVNLPSNVYRNITKVQSDSSSYIACIPS